MPTARRFGLTSSAACVVIGVVVLVLFIAAVPLAGLAHQNLNASSGSLPVWVTAPFAVVAGFAARLKDTVDLDSVRDDLANVGHHALEPGHVSVWISHRD